MILLSYHHRSLYISFQLATINGNEEFQVLANPNGTAYVWNGVVTGCYVPQVALLKFMNLQQKQYFETDGGAKKYRPCQQ